MGTTKHFNIQVEIRGGSIILRSKGTTYEVPLSKRPVVYVLPYFAKEGQWTGSEYAVLEGSRVIFVKDVMVPSQLNITVKYAGTSAAKFIDALRYVVSRYYKGGNIMRLPTTDKKAFRFAIMLARLSELQDISDL
jgi:hypothetical protein